MPPAHLKMYRRLHATPRQGRGGRGNANKRARNIMTQDNMEGYDVEISDYIFLGGQKSPIPAYPLSHMYPK